GDAFAAFERARRELADSLGLEPGKVLTAAHDRLLMPAEHDVRSPSTLVGRDGFIAEVLARLDERPSTLLYGEHGIGKSRLIAVIGNRLARSGSLVANVTATRHPTHAAQVIYEIAEALGKTIDPSLPPTHGLVRVLHELVDGGNRVAILIDDAANLGPASTIAISAATRIERVSVIVTSRTRLELLADSDVLRLEIPPLNETQIAPIVESRLGSPPSPELLSWIWSMSGGNPALVELLTSQPLDQFPPPDGDDSEMGRLFDGLLRIHTAPLSEEGVNTLEVVAVLGTATRSVVLEFVSENGLDEAIVNGLLDQSDKGLIEFRHGALRSALYQAMAPGRRAEYHAFVLRVLERLKASADRIAPHAVACRDLDPLGAARILVRAAARGITAVPARRAEPWFRLALSMAEPLGDAALPVTAAAQIGLAEQLRRMGHPDQRAAAEKAVRLSLSSERPALIAEACSIAARVYGVGADGTVDPAVADLVRHALDVAENDDQVAAVLIGCSKLPPGPALERAGRRAALDALDMTLSPTLQRRTRLTAGRVLSSPADLEIRTLLAEEERDQTSPEYILGFEQRLFELPPLLMRCQGAVAAERAKALEVGVSGAIDLDARLSFGLYSAMLSYLRDDLDEAERTIRTLDELAEVAPTSLAPARKLANLLAIRLAQGRESELLEEIAEHASRQPEVHLWSALHARCLVSTDPHRALTLALRASEESTDHPLWALTAALCGAVGVE
ncbi:MAG: hypothetical protein GX868_09950, partial [Actinobacteria bacterium]|nr:hypothetical protein [Actinomycetota bacterium]